jgi:hypothetical protein
LSVAITDFWRLLAESRLLAPEQCRQLADDFGQVKGAAEQGNAKALGEWLVARNVLSKYQTTILLAGRSGPFHYGEYKVYDRVERGRLAGQFRAVHAPTGHPVLLHFLTGRVITDAHLWATAANEVLAASAIVSPHVQRFFEPVDLQSFKFLVSEDLRGSTLDERLATGRFPPHEACRIARLAAIGLAQMHQCGRVHGDVRPANVLLEPIPGHPGNVKLLLEAHESTGPIDFAAEAADPRLVVKADYLAPELLAPGKAQDPLTDIYALGCTLYAMLSGNPPFAGGSVQQKMTRHAGEPIRPLEQFGVPQPLAQLVAYMMAKNATVRYQSAALVAEQLAPLVDPAALYAQPPGAPPTLANFESFLRQKQAQAAAAPARGFAVVTPVASEPTPVGIAVGQQAGFRSDRDHLGQMAAAATASGGAAVPGIAVTPKGKTGSPGDVEAILKRKEAEQRKTVVVAIIAAGALVIAGIVGINLIGRGGNNQEVASNPAEGEPDPGPQPMERPDPPITTNVDPATSTGPGANPPDSSQGSGATTTPKPPVTVTEVGFQQEVVPDDGSLLWASPTTGKPVAFRMVPPGGSVFMIVRPADLLASSEGAKVLEALGPTFASERPKWEKAAGLRLDEIEQLIITLHNNDAKFPRVSFVVKMTEHATSEQLLLPDRWGNPPEQKVDKATFLAGPTWAYYVGTGNDAGTFVMGEARDVQEVAKVAGNPPNLMRDLERIRRTLDGDRHVSILAHPQFFFNDDGEPLFAGDRKKVRAPLSWLLGDYLQAAAVSLHCGDEFYFELRMLGSLDKEPYQLASEFRDRLNQVPTSLEDYFVDLTPPAYWKKLAFRYPGLVNKLHGNMRVGVENDQAVVNSLLPGAAAHNLVLGGELLIATAPGTALVASTTPPKVLPKTIAEALQLKTTFSFDSQSLEFAVRDLAIDVNDQLKGGTLQFGIKIIGPDLEKDGVTRNISINNFKQENAAIADILTALVMRTSTAKEPTDPGQKLIWVVADDPDAAGKQTILLTTRAAAAAKGYTVPDVFVPKKT